MNRKSITQLSNRIRIEFSRVSLTGVGGLAYLASLAKHWQLGKSLSEAVCLKRRRRGANDEESLLSIIFSLCAGNGYLSDLDSLRADQGLKNILGLCVPSSRRAGEYLQRFNEVAVTGLKGVARQLVARVIELAAKACLRRQGYIPILLDGSEIEVSGQYFEGSAKGFSGKEHLWLHAVFVGDAWSSCRLHGGQVHPAHGWQEQLDADIPESLNHQAVWLRADNAYYGKELLEYCCARGWDCSVSVTNNSYKRPILEDVVRWDEGPWVNLREDGLEQAIYVRYRPSGWSKDGIYAVVKSRIWGQQILSVPTYSVILTSRDDLAIQTVVARHRAKAGHENVFKGPLREMDLHHPPCRSLLSNQAWYLLGQIAQLLLIGAKYELLPKTAHQAGVRSLIRNWIRCSGRIVRKGRYWFLQLSEQVWYKQWHQHTLRMFNQAHAPPI